MTGFGGNSVEVTAQFDALGDREGFIVVHPALLEYYLVPEMGHAWSGPKGEGEYTDRSGQDAAELAWRFAEQHDLAVDDD